LEVKYETARHAVTANELAEIAVRNDAPVERLQIKKSANEAFGVEHRDRVRLKTDADRGLTSEEDQCRPATPSEDQLQRSGLLIQRPDQNEMARGTRSRKRRVVSRVGLEPTT